MFDRSYNALTTSAGFVELDDWSCLKVTGADRAKFLQNMCTNDVQRLQPGEGCEAFFTDVKGHILAHVLVTCRDDSFVLLRSAPQVTDLVSHLDRYIIREDVQLHDRTSEYRYLFVAGPTSGSKLGEIGNSSALSGELASPCSNVKIEIAGIRCTLIRLPIDISAWLLECSSTKVDQMSQQLESAGLEKCDRDSWEIVRIEAGFPLDRVDITEQNLPQEIDRNDRAISFKKGCYLGQETVARIDALGHVNQTLVSVRFTDDRAPPRDAALTAEGKQVGRVTSACFSPREKTSLALTYVRRGHNVPGKRFESEFGAAEVIEIRR
jgi:tRNA-modifying protein YgfZ